VFNGLLGTESEVASAAAARLYRDVFAGALERLPPGVRKLIVIPDGPLQQLPLETLRSTAVAQPIAARYEVVVAPSATLWLQWRGHQAQPARRSVLVFADPELAQSGDSEAGTRTAAFHQGLRLGRLPHSRRESRAIERHLDAVDALVGRDASESALKARDPQQYALLHFAAHAVSDEVRPERSAVLLSAGAEGEDGLLQAREIQHLDLRGRIVILSACDTASGTMLNGEGVLSLARAFFQAGARAVVGTRWRIRDEDGAALFDAFYEHLAAGASLSEALARSKQDAIARGRPADAWGSLILLGDGAARPFAASATSASNDRGRLMLAFLVLALFLSALVFTRVRRSSYR
jgi:CHAT domain-containing protein